LAAYVGATTVDIDIEERGIIHRCPVWATSIMEKRFCPHVARVFLLTDPERARSLLASIRNDLSNWKFESKLAVEFPSPNERRTA
jgi:sensor domain CHASE-containing protein